MVVCDRLVDMLLDHYPADHKHMPCHCIDDCKCPVPVFELGPALSPAVNTVSVRHGTNERPADT